MGRARRSRAAMGTTEPHRNRGGCPEVRSTVALPALWSHIPIQLNKILQNMPSNDIANHLFLHIRVGDAGFLRFPVVEGAESST